MSSNNLIVKYPKTYQYRDVIGTVGHVCNTLSIPKPKLEFDLSVKLHGTNCSIVWDRESNTLIAQSRKSILAHGKRQDHYGFRHWVMEHKDEIIAEFEKYEWSSPYPTVFGEWCGKGIQKKVAISQVEKMFCVFDVVDGELGPEYLNRSKEPELKWVTNDNPFAVESIRLFNLRKMSSELSIPNKIEIDFNDLEAAQSQLAQIVEQVEKQCPFGEYFGLEGIGEGVVCSTNWQNHRLAFKAKGQDHSPSKTKVFAPVDVEAMKGINDFLDHVFTDVRCHQSVTEVIHESEPVEMKRLGELIRWIVNDINDEEQMTIKAHGFEQKKLNAEIANRYRVWFKKYLDQSFGLN